MEAVKGYLLLILQGFYLGSVCQRWTFPTDITALIGSCVEIPCTYRPAWSSGASSPVWYLYDRSYYPEILNTKDSSSVMEGYRDRTSLVPGIHSCTLRIDPVRREDGDIYYPGIAEDRKINAYDIQSGYVRLDVTDKVKVELFGSEHMTEGEAAIIQCAIIHTCGSRPPSLRWNKPGQVKNKSVDISRGSWREESELTYIPSYVDDGSPLQCTATHPNGRKTEGSGTLNILYAPKNVTVTVIGMNEVMEGGDVTLQCNSYSKTYVYEYDWYQGKDKTQLPDKEQEITVMNVTRDTEPYSCAAKNAVGRGDSALTEIPVPYAAIGVHITVKNEREFSALSCDFLRSRPDVTHYTWKKDGSVLHTETGKTLTLYNNEEESYGLYSCVAHNPAGNSSSEEIAMNRDPLDLPLILGSAAGVFFLVLFILVIYLCLRRKKKSAPPTSPVHGTIPARIPYDNTMAKDENQYGNIQSGHHAQPPSMGSRPSVDPKFEDNDVIYGNSEANQPINEIEYCVISHGQPDQTRPTSSRASHAEVVEYATVQKQKH